MELQSYPLSSIPWYIRQAPSPTAIGPLDIQNSHPTTHSPLGNAPEPGLVRQDKSMYPGVSSRSSTADSSPFGSSMGSESQPCSFDSASCSTRDLLLDDFRNPLRNQWVQLPLELQFQIWSYLTPPERLRLRRVNRAWSKWLLHGALWRKIELGASPTDVNEYTAKRLLETAGSSVRHLVFRGYRGLSTATIQRAASTCNHLDHLTIAGCTIRVPRSLDLLFQCNPKLTTVDLSRNQGLTDGHLVTIATLCPQLVSLNVAWCKNITSIGLRRITVFSHKLEQLVVHGVSGVDTLFIEHLAQRCSKLRGLGISQCKGVTDLGIKELARGCPDLTRLDLSYIPQLTNDALFFLAQYCPNLTTLIATQCVGFGDEGLAELARRCARLEVLELEGCFLIGDITLRALAQHGRTLTRVLVDGCAEITDHGVLALLQGCPSLRHVSLTQCFLVTDHTLREWKEWYTRGLVEKQRQWWFGLVSTLTNRLTQSPTPVGLADAWSRSTILALTPLMDNVVDLLRIGFMRLWTRSLSLDMMDCQGLSKAELEDFTAALYPLGISAKCFHTWDTLRRGPGCPWVDCSVSSVYAELLTQLVDEVSPPRRTVKRWRRWTFFERPRTLTFEQQLVLLAWVLMDRVVQSMSTATCSSAVTDTAVLNDNGEWSKWTNKLVDLLYHQFSTAVPNPNEMDSNRMIPERDTNGISLSLSSDLASSQDIQGAADRTNVEVATQRYDWLTALLPGWRMHPCHPMYCYLRSNLFCHNEFLAFQCPKELAIWGTKLRQEVSHRSSLANARTSPSRSSTVLPTQRWGSTMSSLRNSLHTLFHPQTPRTVSRPN
ncbi:hypothetical protein IWQ62_001249 [Dispira parvispora]|uniref:F-box domain-containing protein n=1 Tax=Dispira parvispora TaxID=1520584 RepID=A0A9W8AZG8_9FUNG|nr:hypothetical protein IWQ62_001249 [Dispira parvispora]